MGRTIAGLVAAYLIGAFLTFGYFYNTHVWVGFDSEPHQDGLGGAVVGMIWPIYWAGRAAIEVTK